MGHVLSLVVTGLLGMPAIPFQTRKVGVSSMFHILACFSSAHWEVVDNAHTINLN